MTTLCIFEVTADSKTGEWIGEPVDTGKTTTLSDWCKREDTEEMHFDTYVYDIDTQAERAIIVRFA